MSWLTENPVPVLIASAAIEVILLLALIFTGRGKFLGGLIGVAVVAGLLVLLERLIVTDREAIHDTLFELVAAVEHGNVDRALHHLSQRPETNGLRTLIEGVLPVIDVQKVTILELTIETDRRERARAASPRPGPAAAPPQRIGRARFVAIAEASSPEYGFQIVRTGWTLVFVPEEKRWVLWYVERYDGPGEVPHVTGP